MAKIKVGTRPRPAAPQARRSQPGAGERDYLIQLPVPEFTCHCPLTGQPDFAHFTIEMIADRCASRPRA
jgi:7-cyano-7-deazaguanine reductase